MHDATKLARKDRSMFILFPRRAYPKADLCGRPLLADKSRSDRRPNAAERDDLTAHLPGGERRVARSERQVGIEVGWTVIGHELIAPGLLSLPSVHHPDGLA
jgi:hypothetical protein